MPVTRGRPTSRWSDSTGGHVSGRRCGALAIAASGPASWTPSTTNAAPGLISNSCWPAGSAIGVGSARPCRDRARRRAARRPWWSTEVWTNCPATRDDRAAAARQRRPPRSRLRAASAAAIGRPCGVERGDLGQPGRLELVETQCGAVDDVVPVQQADTLTVSVTRGPQCHRLRAVVAVQRGAPAGRRRGRWRPASDVRAAPTNSASAARPLTSAAAGSLHRQGRRRAGAAPRRCGAVHAVRGSPSVAA